jgi:hypothetical protein
VSENKLVADEVWVWNAVFSFAYSYGHNVPRMGGRRLVHFASAYADVCESSGRMLDLGDFYAKWESGNTYEGTPDEHWATVS